MFLKVFYGLNLIHVLVVVISGVLPELSRFRQDAGIDVVMDGLFGDMCSVDKFSNPHVPPFRYARCNRFLGLIYYNKS